MEQSRKRWNQLSIEPREEAWNKLSEKLNDETEIRQLGRKIRNNQWLAVASVLILFVSMYSIYSLDSSSSKLSSFSKVRLENSLEKYEVFKVEDIYNSRVRIHEGNRVSTLVVRRDLNPRG